MATRRQSLAVYTLLVFASLACKPSEQSSSPSSSAQSLPLLDSTTQTRELAQALLGRSYNHSYRIRTEYDNVDDYTTVTVGEFTLQGGLRLEVYFLSTGRHVEPPRQVTFHFSSSSESWRYLDYNSLRFLLDDSIRIDLGEQRHRGDIGSGYVLEQFFATMAIDDFVRLAEANRVQGRLGVTDFVFSPKQLEGLRDLAKHMFAESSSN